MKNKKKEKRIFLKIFNYFLVQPGNLLRGKSYKAIPIQISLILKVIFVKTKKFVNFK